MIMLTIRGKTHDLSVADAKQQALAIAAEVDEPGQARRFRGTDTAFCVQIAGTAPAKADMQTFSRAGITLTDC